MSTAVGRGWGVRSAAGRCGRRRRRVEGALLFKRMIPSWVRPHGMAATGGT